MKLEVWLPIALAAVGVIVPIAIFLLNRRKGKKDQYRQLLDQFLNPLNSILERNKNAFEALVKDHKIEVDRLEFFPSDLKLYFQRLPDSDLRKTFWMADIERIHSVNQDAIQLIKTYAGNTLLRSSFRQACTDFVKHAEDWKSRWDYALGPAPMAASTSEQQIASTFPESMEQELPIETNRISALAGINPNA